MPAQSVVDDDDRDDTPGGFAMRREGALRAARQRTLSAAGFSRALSRAVAVEAPRVPLITYAVSMFGGAAMGAVQVRRTPAAAPSARVLLLSAFLRVQGLEWFASLLREDDDGDVADEFLSEAACAQDAPAATQRGALRTLAVTRRPRCAPAWQRVVGGWPQCGEAT